MLTFLLTNLLKSTIMKINYTLFPFIVCCVVGIYAQNTVINDPNFEQALIDLGYDSDNTINGTVLTSDISGRTSLMIPSKNITDLTGIEDFISLTNLTCNSNQITSLDLSNNTALTRLQCYDNQLTSIDVTQNTALTFLNVNINQLESIDLSQNTLLTTLGIYDNQLTSLDITKNTALVYVQCQVNQISDLDVSQNTALLNLNCSGNLFTSLDLSYNTALTTLNCGASQLSVLDISQNTLLTNLSCSYNSLLTDLDLTHNLELDYLYCSGNPLLETLDITYNTKLTDISCFSNPLLTTLDVSQNTALTKFYGPETPFTSLDFSTNNALTVLNCSYNSQLLALNVKNGNNALLTSMDARGCLSLECIQVDDETAANEAQAPYTNWEKVTTTVYAEDCSALGMDDYALAKSIRLFPNPATNVLHMDTKIPIEKVELYSILCKNVMTITSGFDTIPMEQLANGIYIVKIQSKYGVFTKKLIKK